MDDIKARQQVVDKIKKSTNILITVSNDPSVDALSAALALTLLVDKLDKHGTAVFSGTIPPAIAFLEPEKTFERTTDSLRDFIIALDKEKADHLRYKVDGDVVKIFITPYKTTITGDDLKFSQGDFNVELVIALGVDKQEHLDSALDAHGKILHDASVITITAGKQSSNLGTIAWHDSKASGLSEMMSDLTESLKADATEASLLDKQIATALLTGIVAQTDRFSNPHTSAKTMTTAANLMAAGADQQLIAAKLEESHEIKAEPAPKKDEHTVLKEGEPTKVVKDGGLQISHSEEVQDQEQPAEPEKPSDEGKDDNDGPEIAEVHSSTDAPLVDEEPSMGGTLNATSGQAAEDARHQKDNDQNKTILTHSYLGAPPADQPAMNATDVPESQQQMIDLLTRQASPDVHSAYAPDPDPEPEQPAAEAAPTDPAPPPSEPVNPTPAQPPADASTPMPPPTPAPATPSSMGLPMPPPLPDFSAQNNMTPAYAPDPTPAPADTSPERLGDILAPEQPAASTPPSAPVDPAVTPPIEPQQPPVTAEPAPTPPNDPAQFKIPGQP